MVSELQQPTWAVITDKEVVASSLPYDEAKSVRDAHARATKNGGTCVVTDKAAGVQKGKDNANQA